MIDQSLSNVNQSPSAGHCIDKNASRVRDMFAEIAPRYDLVNRVLSGGIDLWWRRVTVRLAPPPDCGAVLDVCTGTGDLALAYAARCNPGVRVVASDFCQPMLDRGIQKSQTLGALKNGVAVEWIQADAMHLPFSDALFDLVTVSFGLRNIAETNRGLTEMARVCKPGGRMAILEFSLPSHPLVRRVYLWYFRNVLPWIGNTVSHNASNAYTYLNQSVEAFPSGTSLVALIRQAGFTTVKFFPLTFGIATLYVAIRADQHLP